VVACFNCARIASTGFRLGCSDLHTCALPTGSQARDILAVSNRIEIVLATVSFFIIVRFSLYQLFVIVFINNFQYSGDVFNSVVCVFGKLACLFVIG